MPALDSGGFQVVAALSMIAILGRVGGNESRMWYMVLAAILLSPPGAWDVALVAAIMSLLLRPVEMIRKLAR